MQALRHSFKAIVMLAVHPESKLRGGVASVIDEYRRAGLFERWPIHYIGTMKSGSPLTKARVATSALFEYLRVLASGRMAIVHAHMASRASFWRKSMFVMIAKLARKPIVIHLHGAEFDRFYDQECGPLVRKIVRFVLSSATKVVVLSTQWRQTLARIAPRASTVVIPNPVRLEGEVPPQHERAGKQVLFLGRFGQRKGIFDLLRAIEQVRQQHPDVQLRCGGDGDRDGVEKAIAELGIAESVHMLGWVSGDRKRAEFHQAAIYVLPSYAEGLPMGVLEAMAAGAAVIATDVGGIPDAIDDGVNGFLVRPGDVDALAARIVQLLDDATLRERLATAARTKVAHVFSTEKVMTQIDALYRSLGAPPRASQPQVTLHRASANAPD